MAGSRKPRMTVGRVEEALRASGGIKTIAAHKLKCHRATLYRFIDRHPDLNAVISDIVGEIGDIAEAKVVEAIRSGDMPTVRWYLETKAKDRGYSRRTEMVGKDDGPMEVKADMKLDLSSLTVDELRQMVEIQDKIALAQGKTIEEIVGGNGRHGTVEFANCGCSTCSRARRLRERQAA